MTPIKKLFYRLQMHRWLLKPANKAMAAVQFIRFCSWMSKNSQLAVNDFPTKTDYLKRYKVHEYIAHELVKNAPINYLEFGTADCETFLWWLQQNSHAQSRFFGFDTFTGLPEDWGNYKKGAFSLSGEMPVIADTRASLHKGLFQDTLHEFLRSFKNDLPKVILLDADLYSATLFVLTTLAPYLKQGDILIFDEFSSQEHEYLAYENFLKAYPYITLTCFAASNNYSCVAFRVEQGKKLHA